MERRAQGALEFLMTYGWAFLVILIMIGALAYFGILNPTRFLPDRCDFGAQFLCKKDQYIINNSDTFTTVATLVNNVGSNIMVYEWNITTDVPAITNPFTGGAGCDACFGGDCATGDSVAVNQASAVLWREGESKTFVLDCPGGSGLVEGDKVKFLHNFKWYSTTAGSGFARDGRGELFSAVQ